MSLLSRTKQRGGGIGRIHSTGGKKRISCRNGMFSDSVGKGTCSHNGGMGAGQQAAAQSKKAGKKASSKKGGKTFTPEEAEFQRKKLSRRMNTQLSTVERKGRVLQADHGAIDTRNRLNDLYGAFRDPGLESLVLSFQHFPYTSAVDITASYKSSEALDKFLSTRKYSDR